MIGYDDSLMNAKIDSQTVREGDRRSLEAKKVEELVEGLKFNLFTVSFAM